MHPGRIQFVFWKNARDLLGYTEKKFLLNGQFKKSKTKKWRKSKNNKNQRKSTVSSYKKECVFILL